MRVNQQAAYVLHRQPYSNSSLLVDVITAEYGRFRLVAKGVRNAKSPRKALLQAFTPIKISWSGKSELKTLTGVELNSSVSVGSFQGNTLFNGMYINELLMKLLYPADPHDDVYALYQQTLLQLHDSQQQEISLRFFEYQLLEMLGYSLGLNEENLHADHEAWYQYHHEYGLVPANIKQTSSPKVQAQHLLQLINQQPCNAEALYHLKQFMRFILLNRLEGKVIQSRRMYL